MKLSEVPAGTHVTLDGDSRGPREYLKLDGPRVTDLETGSVITLIDSVTCTPIELGTARTASSHLVVGVDRMVKSTNDAVELARQINLAHIDGMLPYVLEEWRVLLRQENTPEALATKKCVADFEKALEAL